MEPQPFSEFVVIAQFVIYICGITGVVADIKVNLQVPAEEILRRSLEVMTTMGEWELLDIKAQKRLLLSFNNAQDPIDDLTFYVCIASVPCWKTVSWKNLTSSFFLIVPLNDDVSWKHETSIKKIQHLQDSTVFGFIPDKGLDWVFKVIFFILLSKHPGALS